MHYEFTLHIYIIFLIYNFNKISGLLGFEKVPWVTYGYMNKLIKTLAEELNKRLAYLPCRLASSKTSSVFIAISSDVTGLEASQALIV